MFNRSLIHCAKRQKQGVELTVFPELCLTGYTSADLFYQSALLDRARASLTAIGRGKRHIADDLCGWATTGCRWAHLQLCRFDQQWRDCRHCAQKLSAHYTRILRRALVYLGTTRHGRSSFDRGSPVPFGVDLLFVARNSLVAFWGSRSARTCGQSSRPVANWHWRVRQC